MWGFYAFIIFGFMLLLAALAAYCVAGAEPKPPLFYPAPPVPEYVPSVFFSLDPAHYTIPMRAHPADAGIDLSVAMSMEIVPNGIREVDTGIRVAIPKGYVGFLCLRSGFAVNNPDLCLVNNVGVIDSGYTGNIKAVFKNGGDKVRTLRRGTRFAQLVITPCLLGTPQFVRSLNETERGDGGFGSTGQ